MKKEVSKPIFEVAIILLALVCMVHCSTGGNDDSPSQPDGDGSENPLLEVIGERGDIVLRISMPGSLSNENRFELYYRERGSESWISSRALGSPSDGPEDALELIWHSALDLFGENGSYEIELRSDNSPTLSANPITINNSLALDELRIDHDRQAPANSSYPSLSVNDDSSFGLSWLDGRSGRSGIYAAASEDDGLSWGDEDIGLNLPSQGKIVSRPRSLALSDGSVSAFWLLEGSVGLTIQFNGMKTDKSKFFEAPGTLGKALPLDATVASMAVGRYGSGFAAIWSENSEGRYRLYGSWVSELSEHQFSGTLLSDQAESYEDDLNPAIAIDGETSHIVWRRDGEGCALYYRRIENGLAEAGTDELVASYLNPDPDPDNPLICIFRPHVFVLADKRIAVFHVSPEPGARGIVMHTRSESGQWSEESYLSSAEAAPVESLVSDQDHDGTIALAWTDARNEGYYDIYSLAIAPDGSPLGPELRADSGHGEDNPMSYSPQVDIADGRIHLLWQDIHYLTREESLVYNSRTIGEEFSEQQIIADGPDLYRLAQGYSLAASEQRTVISFFDYERSVSGIKVLASSPDGSWVSPARAPGIFDLYNSHAGSPVIASYADELAAAYINRFSKGYRAEFAVFQHNGDWSDPEEIPGQNDDSSVGRARLAYDTQGNLHALLEKEREDGGKALVAALRNPSGKWQGSRVLNPEDESPLPSRASDICAFGESEGVVASWIDLRESTINLYCRPWNEENDWSEEFKLNDDRGVDSEAVDVMRSKLVCGKNKLLTASWIGTSGGLYALFLRASTDAGANFHPESSILIRSADNAMDFDLATFDDRKIVAVSSAKDEGDLRQVFMMRSTDAGETWDASPLAIAERSADIHTPSVSIVDENRLNVFWWRNDEETGTLTLEGRHSQNFGDSFMQTRQFASMKYQGSAEGMLQACSNAAGTVFILYQLHEDDADRLELAASHDGGLSWASFGAVTDERQGGLSGRLHCRENGGIDIVFGSLRDGFEQIFSIFEP